MLESSIALTSSRYRQYALLLAMLWGALVFLLLPLSGYRYAVAAVILSMWFYMLLRAWYMPFEYRVLHITAEGGVHWQPANQDAGQLSPRSLVTQWFIQLCWQDQQQKNHIKWIFSDQLSAADYRALARHIQLQRWR
ncbi:hypothetical protein GCM10008111_21590 [Alishewanella tabrizica]|uniref:Toxin CptA n=1 Tax=Alishewanella tabrizica TaxID=671278 RepID=A0ABQ2WS00_9ALTE|nr:hypothetical protein GCM10008111_21590 [Alishewanella tabrizica]